MTLAFALMLALAAGDAQSDTAIPPQVPTLALDQVRGADPAVLAARVLPPDAASKVVGGLVRRQWAPGQVYFIRLDERAEIHAPEMCRRLSHIGGAGAPAALEAASGDMPLALQPFSPVVFYAPTYPMTANEAMCQTAKGWIGTPPDRPEPTLRMLARLTDAMRQAAGDAPLPFDIACTTETSHSTSGPCPDARRALADLPLDSLLSILLQNTVYQDEPIQNGIRVRKMQPVEDDRWPQAEVSFAASPPDGKSWIVILKGVDRLEAVEMRRTTIIRH